MGLPGNIVRITDGAQQSLFYDDAFVAPANNYTYDAIYRLIAATGREHASNGDVQVDDNDQPIRNLPLATSPTAVRNYEETYQYDAVGNILEMFHDAGSGAATWTRTYTYVSGKNQLASHNAPGPSTVTFTHDAHGNMVAMPHLAAIDYTPFDQMMHADLGGGGDSYYVYDSGGTRIRKVIDTGMNLIKERIYLGSFEIYREIVSSTVDKERQTLHVLDGVKRIAMVETLTIEDGDAVSAPEPKQRYQLGNHLGSALLELDETGLIVSYEEYHPYGTSACRSARSGVEVSARRYRYIGMERDDETGLYLMGARYYACWLGRWTSADPMGIGADGPGLNNYTRGSPVTLSDPSGHDDDNPNRSPATFLGDPLRFLREHWDEKVEAGPLAFVEGTAEKMSRPFKGIYRTFAPEGMLDLAARKFVHEYVLDEPYREYITEEQHNQMGWDALDTTLFLFPGVGEANAAAPGPRRFAFDPIPVGGDAALTPGFEVGFSRPWATDLPAVESVPGWYVGGTLSFAIGDPKENRPDEAPEVPSEPPPAPEFCSIEDAAEEVMGHSTVPAALQGRKVTGIGRIGDIGPLKSPDIIEQVTRSGYDPADFRAVQYQIEVEGGGSGIITVFEAEGGVYVAPHWSSANY